MNAKEKVELIKARKSSMSVPTSSYSKSNKSSSTKGSNAKQFNKGFRRGGDK